MWDRVVILYIIKKTDKKAGSILIYVKNNLKVKIIKDLSVSDSDSECVTVEIQNKNSKKMIITVVIDGQVVLLKDLIAF